MFGGLQRAWAGAILYVTLATGALAATGDWDYSYGAHGRLALTIPQGPFTVRTWRPQADGKLLVAGTIGPVFGETRVLARFNDNGALDPTFDGDGVLVLPWASSTAGNDIGVEILPGGKILTWTSNVVFGGNAYYSTFFMRRLNPDGSLDASFGNGGEVVYPFGDYTYRGDIALTPQGGIVLIGLPSTSDGRTTGRITRLTSSGAIDTTFGTNGTVQIEAPDVFGVSSMALHADGSLSIGGVFGYYPGDSSYVAHITPDGRLDSNFGEGGIFVVPFLDGPPPDLSDVVAAPGGKVYIAGMGTDLNGIARGYIARLTATGQLDPTFGSGGRIVTNGSPISLALEPDGKILAAGTSDELSGAAWAARYNSDGSPDVTFGLRGRSRLDLTHATAPAAAVLRELVRYPDGSYRALAGWSDSVSMVRLLAGGASPGVIGIRGQDVNASPFEYGYSFPVILMRTGGADGVVSVQYRFVADTATAGSDFVATTGVVTFNDGEVGPKLVMAQILDDTLYENDETFHIELFGATGGAELAQARLDLTIGQNHENDTSVGFVTSNVTVTEGAGVARLIVRRTESLLNPLTVTYTTNNPAMVGSDFTGATGTVTWGANEGGARVIEFPIVDDGASEGPESFGVMLSSSTPDSIYVAGSSAGVAIVDDDDASQAPSAYFTSTVQTVSEAAGSVTLTVARLGNPATAVSANWTTVNASSAAEGQDYAPASGTLSWGAGDAAPKTIVITLANDAAVEGLESFVVRLTGNGGLYIPAHDANVYIQDDEVAPAPPVISISAGANVNEGAGAVTATISMTGVPQAPVTVRVRRELLTASESDIGPGGATLTWAAGDTSPRTVSIAITQDSIDEADETFYLNLDTPTGGATIATALAQYTIVDDDPTPPGQPAPVVEGVRLPVKAMTVREDQRTVTFQVERVGNPAATLYTQYYVVSGEAANPDDYYGASGQMIWGNGATDPRQVEIQLNGDAAAEPTETFTVRFASSSGGLLDEITFTVIDDDGPLGAPARVGFIAATQVVAESAGSVTLSVGRTGNTAFPSSVDYTTASGSAGAADFTASTGTLTWAANDTSTKLLTIALTPDNTNEPAETFTVTLRNPSVGTQLDTATATVTISDSDVTVVSPPSSKGGGGGGEESLLALLLWGSLASLRLARAARMRG